VPRGISTSELTNLLGSQQFPLGPALVFTDNRPPTTDNRSPTTDH